MHRADTRLSLIALVLALTLLVTGCASSGGGGAADVPSAPPPPAKKAFVAPDFEAKVYENTDLGFSLHYPAEFAEEDRQGSLLSVASPQQVPRVDVFAAPGEMDSLDEVSANVAAGFSQLGGGDATVTSAKEVKLQDGVTDAMEFVVDWAFQGFPIQSLALVVPADGQILQVSVTWADALGDRESANVDAIAYSLYFD